jgi:hypothetical protein
MCDEWMPTLRLRLSPAEFRCLPRNSAYRYDYVNGEALLSPNARCYHAVLDLERFRPTEGAADGVRLRPMRADDFDALETVFAASFACSQPFACLDDETRRQAARACLRRTRDGGDGPWIEPASFVAEGAAVEGPSGAILVTLLPGGDPSAGDSYHWTEPPPADCLARRLGRPHLTWVFVVPQEAACGTGSALLAESVRALRALGYREMASTFMVGNDTSTLWHWRNGFELQPYAWSKRRWRR